MSKTTMIARAALLAFLFLTLAVFISNKIFQPLHLDEVINFNSSLRWNDYACILPLYYGFTWIFDHTFSHIEFSRIFILLINLISWGTLFYLLSGIFKDTLIKRISVISLALVSPVLIESLIFWDENIFLNMILSLFLVVYYSRKNSATLFRKTLLAVLFCCMLWTKLTTSFIFPVFSLLLVFIEHKTPAKRFHYTFRDILYIYGIGTVLFMISYLPFNHYFELFPAWTRFLYILNRSHFMGIPFLVLQIILLTFWLSPYFYFALGWTLKRALEKKDMNDISLLVLVLIIFLSYAKTHFFAGSYPKYLVWPLALSYLIIFKNYFIKYTEIKIRDLFVLLLSGGYFYFILKDPLLYSLPVSTASFAEQGAANTYGVFALKKLVIMLLPLAGLLFFKLNKVKYVFLLLVAYGFSLTWHQSLASYSTIYAYGERGLTDLVSWAKRDLEPTSKVFGVKDLDTYYYPFRKTTAKYVEFIDDYREYIRQTREVSPDFMVIRDYYLSDSTASPFKDEMQDLGYSESDRFGHFIVYKRR